MRSVIRAFRNTVILVLAAGASVAAQEAPSTKHTASLAEFGKKIQALEEVVDAIALAGALALLSDEHSEWSFDRASGFDGSISYFTSDIGAVSVGYEYNLSKLRGAIFRNKSVTDEHRERGLTIFGEVKELVSFAYEFERYVEADDLDLAADLYKTEILQRADALVQNIGKLTEEVEQAIKFSAL